MRAVLRLTLLGLGLLAACDGGRDRLIADLQSQHPEARMLAVRKLAAQARPDDLVLFTRAARDPAAMVRAEATSALGKSQDARVVDLLGELLTDSDEGVQAKAAMALAEFKSDKAKAYLSNQYSRRGQSTRQAIVEALKASNVPGAMAQVVALEAQNLWERNLETLKTGTLAERVGAAEALGKSGRAEAVNRLLETMRDPQVILSAAAVRGLGYAGDPRAVAPIAALLSESYPELREAACNALLRLKDPSALPKLREVALENSAASPLALQAIAALPDSPEASRALCEAAVASAPALSDSAARLLRARSACPKEILFARLSPGFHASASTGRVPSVSDRDREAVVAALRVLGGIGPAAKEHGAFVQTLVRSADPAVRAAALHAAAGIRDLGPAPAGCTAKACAPSDVVLEAHLANRAALEAEREDWVKGGLPKAYGQGFDPAAPAKPTDEKDGKASPRTTEDLLRKAKALTDAKAGEGGKILIEPRPPRDVLDDARPGTVALTAEGLRALGALKIAGAEPQLDAFIDDESPKLRAAAFAGLATLGGGALKKSAAGLRDPDRGVQSETALALAASGGEGQALVAELLPNLRDKLPHLEALLAAPELSLPSSAPLVAVVKEGGPESALAAELLGRIKAQDAVPMLLEALDDPTTVARRDIVVALGQIGAKGAEVKVAAELYNDSPEVRAAAAEALGRLRSTDALESLDALKSDYYRRVRETAEIALAQLGQTPKARD